MSDRSGGAGAARARDGGQRRRGAGVTDRPERRGLLELAAALNHAGESVALNQARIERVAKAYDVADARVAVLPQTDGRFEVRVFGLRKPT